MRTVITLSPFIQSEEQHIAIGFIYNRYVKAYIKAFPGVSWSENHRTYCVKNKQDTVQILIKYLQKNHYYVDYSSMKKKIKLPNKTNRFSSVILYKELPLELRDCLKRFVVFLKGKRYSSSTISTYGTFVLRFMHYSKSVAISEWRLSNMQRFIEDVIAKEGYSISSHRQCVSALKLLSTFCNLEDFDASNLERPKKSRYLPTILSKEEVIDLIQVTKNLKHRAIIGLLYSSGLRISELLNLKKEDLDFDRSQVHIKLGKGRKDRTVVMSEVIKPLLLNYLNTYMPNLYFIEGRDGGIYSDTSVRHFIKASAKAANIRKRVSPHTLRHSYATHMLENGVDLRYIQDLLGHAKPETTMIYTHVAQKDLMKISSPLDVTIDQLNEKGHSNKKVLISRNNS
ncbi:site-specific tyrosine recombinase/integron integrase [Tamlana sp. I1]|uniref:site-specific tyrosine recombinase/integron integrase n=1 Tax=Tamlana sp. I1 TaxID=2762061 RepID=UPI00188E7BB8|nr:site-specific tyrosine recombinase/integron integrase [Tamlana sp. I1]